MKTPHEHSIPPLTEASWQRIEEGLFQRLAAQPVRPAPPPRAALPWALAVAATVLLASVTTLKLRDPAPQRFTTGVSGQQFVLPGVSLQLEPDSALQVAQAPGSAVVCTLERGAARFEVASRKGRGPLSVLADDVRVEVVGTVFRVAHVSAGVSVQTYEGTVRVSARGESMLLQRGETWPAAPAPVLAAPLQQPAAAVPAVEPKAQAPRTASARARFEEASACEKRDYKKALQLYEQLAHEPGAWASNGLYALGRLELERGLERKAERHLLRYLQLYPNGANAIDARALLGRIRASE